MPKLSFWDTIIDEDMSWREVEAINAAHDEASLARQELEGTTTRVQKLEQVVARQRLELGQLRAAVDTLLHMLADQGVVDREMFGYRLEAAIENARERAQQPVDTAACTGCGEQVMRASTTITADGLLCPRCLAIASR